MKIFCKYCSNYTANNEVAQEVCFIKFNDDNHYESKHIFYHHYDPSIKNRYNNCNDFTPRWYCWKSKRELKKERNNENKSNSLLSSNS